MKLFKKIRAVWYQTEDFNTFKEALSIKIEKEKKKFDKKMETLDKRRDSYQKLSSSMREKFHEDVIEFTQEAKEFYAGSEVDKKDQFKEWRNRIFQIFIGWFLLISADKITGTNLIAQYFVIFAGIYITWKSLIDISLLGQRSSYARSCLRQASELRNRTFCFLKINDKCFKNDDGLTKFYISTTKSQIKQHKDVIIILIISIFITIGLDLTPIIFNLFNI